MTAQRNRDQAPSENPEGSEKPETERKPRTQGMATETPVPTRRKVSRYIISVEDATGTIIKMERIDEKSGKAQELTKEEYAAAYSAASYSSPYYAASAAMFYDPTTSPAMQAYTAYIKTISDYLKTLSQPINL